MTLHLKKCIHIRLMIMIFCAVPHKDMSVCSPQVAHKQSSSTSLGELEQRVHDLTESLIHKQTNIETLSTEKHSLIIQMERLQVTSSSQS